MIKAYRGHDYPEVLPFANVDASEVLLTVEESVHYALLGQDSDDEWNAASPVGKGFVRLGPQDRIFAISMFHELHCLRMINLGLHGDAMVSPAHLKHCLGKLRQGILCGSDLTLEPGDFEEREYKAGDIGATHVCKDWSLIYPVVDVNYRRWLNLTDD
jgi:hypothetical protein